jgi:hypothetical protein
MRLVTGPHGWEALWLVEDVAVLLQEVGQERMRLVKCDHHQLKLRGRSAGAADARPLNATAPRAPEDEGQHIEVSKDGD